MNFVEMMTEKDSYTKNGAVTNSTSHNFCVDLFFLAGACRNEDVKAIENVITKAYAQDRLKTQKNPKTTQNKKKNHPAKNCN